MMTGPEFQKRKREHKKIVVVTAYDALFTRIVEEAGMEVILVGDSLGVVVQGKKDTLSVTMEEMLADAKALEAAGAFAIVLEAVPANLARTISEALTIPTIGIGAGPHCDGQVLVLYDLLGLFDDFVPKFVKPYAHLKADALQALRRYKEEVELGKFPTDSESYH